MDEQLLAKRYSHEEKYTRVVELGMRLGQAINRMRDKQCRNRRPLTRIRARHA